MASAPPPRDMSPCTCLRLRKATRRLSQIYDRHLAQCGLSVSQYGLLAQLKAEPGISIGALAERLIMDPTTLTRGIRPLEQRGLVAVRRDDEDRRTRRLALTPEGLQLHALARPLWAGAQREVERIYGAAETRALHGALDLLLERCAP